MGIWNVFLYSLKEAIRARFYLGTVAFIGVAILGGAIIGGFVAWQKNWPIEYWGAYFFADYTHQTISYLKFHPNGTAGSVHVSIVLPGAQVL